MKRLKIIQAARKERVCHTSSGGELRSVPAAGGPKRGFDEGPLPERHTGVVHKGESYGLYHAYGEQRAACVWCVAAAFGRKVGAA